MSRPVFSFRPNLKNSKHEKAWRILQDVPAGQRNQYLVDVILEQEERGTVREELKSGDVERMPAQEKEEIPGQMLDFLFQMEQE